VAPRNYEPDRWEGWCLNFVPFSKPSGTKVPLKVIDGKERESPCPRPCAANTCSNKERSDKTRTGGEREPFNLARYAKLFGLLQHFIQQAWQPFVMRSRCNLWNNATEGRVNRRLTCNTFGKHLATTAHERNRTLVATGFNRE
jgi:hypothetical protein